MTAPNRLFTASLLPAGRRCATLEPYRPRAGDNKREECKMNGFVKSCALALAACLLAGCAPSLPPQPTLDELLAEVNAAHQAVH